MYNEWWLFFEISSNAALMPPTSSNLVCHIAFLPYLFYAKAIPKHLSLNVSPVTKAPSAKHSYCCPKTFVSLYGQLRCFAGKRMANAQTLCLKRYFPFPEVQCNPMTWVFLLKRPNGLLHGLRYFSPYAMTEPTDVWRWYKNNSDFPKS